MDNTCFITTVDNPFDYFVQFDEWLNFDRTMGYFTLELVARTAMLSDNLSDKDNELEIENAFNKIIEWHSGLYKRVYPKKTDSIEQKSG